MERTKNASGGYQRLGDILLGQGAVTKRNLEKGLEVQAQTGRLLGEILVDYGFASEDAIAVALAAQFWCSVADLTQTPDPRALKLVPSDFAISHLVLPLSMTADEFHCAIADPLDFATLERVRQLTNRRVVASFAGRSSLGTAIHNAYFKPRRLSVAIDRVALRRLPKRDPQDDRRKLLEALHEGRVAG